MNTSDLFPSTRPYRIKDLRGQQFGLLTVISFAGIQPRNTPGRQDGRTVWLCRCICGREKPILSQSLLSGLSKSCGCRGNPNGTTGGLCARYPQEYSIWEAMWARCTNPHNQKFKDYGGRGITVDPLWRSFETFLHDMGVRPGPEYSIDRISNELGYSKSNCRWATAQEQTRNTRRNRWLTHHGVTKCIEDWAQDLGIHVQTLRSRLKAGWPPDEAFSSILRGRTEITHNGVTQCVEAWARELSMHPTTLKHRIKAGFPPELIFSSTRLNRFRQPVKSQTK